MDEKESKKITERVENILGDAMKKIAPQFEGMAKEIQKLARPKSKKNIKLNGVNVVLSLVEDGRVVITCSTIDEAQKIYDSEFKVAAKECWYKKIFKK